MKRENLEHEVEIIEERLEHNIKLLHEDEKNDTSYLRRAIRNDQHYHLRLTGKYYTIHHHDEVMHDFDKYGESGVA